MHVISHFSTETGPGPTLLVTVVFGEQNYTLGFSGQWKNMLFTDCRMPNATHTHTKNTTFRFVGVEEYTHSALHTDSNLFVQPMQCDSISLSLSICARIIYKNTCWIGSAMCGHFFFAHPHFISLRFVRENRTPLGAFALLRQFLSLDSLLSLLVCFLFPPLSVSRVRLHRSCHFQLAIP